MIDWTDWHQRHAARQAYRLRKHAAHVWADDYIQTGRMLCGQTSARVTVNREHAHKPHNRTCKKCLAALAKIK